MKLGWWVGNLSSITNGQIFIDAMRAKEEFGGIGHISQTSYATVSIGMVERICRKQQA